MKLDVQSLSVTLGAPYFLYLLHRLRSKGGA